ncbi:mycobactin polyketide synthase MbtD [Mycobacterium sp. OAE908]|uniref:mycobactin polyketide synthase MbtD n=1 Tax=Mycobacterium sp. OAE908 TaxID=2817899 RepID=UPI001AE1A0EF
MIAFPDGRTPVVLSAHAEELIAADAQAILRYLDRSPDVRAVAATLLRTRRLRRHRAVVRAADVAELAAGLRALAAGEDHPLVACSSETSTSRTAYMLPGQGSQWPAMGAEAYRELPVYRVEVDKCAAAFVAVGVQSPLPYLMAEGDFSQIQTQAAQFTHAAALAQVWKSCGILPDITVGHSLGEVAAAYIAGTITLADAAAVVIARAQVVDRLPGRYGMAVLGISVTEAERLIDATPGWLELSVVNASSSVVVSGEREAVTAIVTACEAAGRFARELGVDFPAHTSALEPLQSDLVARLPHSQFADTPVPFIGSATGTVVMPGTDFADYWYRNLRNTVRFDRAIAAAREYGAGRFIELSAHPALLFALGDLVGDDDPVAVGSGRRDEPMIDVLSGNIAAAAVADPGYRWAELVDLHQRPLSGFPNAPMHAVHLWATPEPLPPLPGLTVAAEKWEAKTQSEPALALRRIAVLELAGPIGPLAGQLRDAIDAHPTAQLADQHAADMLVAVAPLLDHPDTERAADEIARLLEHGLLDYAGAIGTACRDVWLVTVGGEHVRPDEPVALPAQAALAAMHRSIGFEHPDQTFRHLDLTSWDLQEAAVVVEALLGESTEVAVRDGTSGPTLYTRTLPEVDPAEPWQLDAGLLDDAVITGGSGTVGLHYARYLANRGARRIVLLSRNGVAADALSVPGVELVAPRCDITSAEQVRAAALEYGGPGASLVIHAAGAATFAPCDAIAAEAFTKTVAAKVMGLAWITELWPLRSDARIVLCSSVSGVWGGKGHAAYSAANRMLDVVAGQLRAEGRHCVSAKYGLWGAGIISAEEVTRIERSGLLPMTPEAAIEASLRDHPADPLILAADRGRLQTFFDSRRSGETDVDAAPSEVDNAARVRAALAAALNLGDAATIDLSASLLDLGVDSLLALDLRKRLRRATGRSVPLADLLGGITGDELIERLGTPDNSEKVDTSRD